MGASASLAEQPVHIGIVTCVWRRPHLTRAMLRYYRRASECLTHDGILLTAAVAGSEGAHSRRLCNDVGFLYTESPNHPLSNKWNSAVKLLRSHEPDAILVVGSDDWLSHGFLRGYARLLRSGHDYLTLKEVYLLNAKNKRCLRFRGSTGVARMLHRSVLDRLQWQVWPDSLNRTLDHGMKRRLKTEGIEPQQPWIGYLADVAETAVAVDVKTATNLWSFRHLARCTRKVEPQSYLDVLRHFDHIDREDMETAMRLECSRA